MKKEIAEKLFQALKSSEDETLHVETFLFSECGFTDTEATNLGKGYAEELIDRGLAKAITLKYFSRIEITAKGRRANSYIEYVKELDAPNVVDRSQHINVGGNFTGNLNQVRGE